MLDLDKFSKLEFTWAEFEKSFLPLILKSEISYLLYQDDKLIVANEAFLNEFHYHNKPLSQIGSILFPNQEDYDRFKQIQQKTLQGQKVENDFFQIVKGNGDKKEVRIQFGLFSIKDAQPICGCFILEKGIINPSDNFPAIGSEDIFKIVIEKSINGIVLVNDRLQIIYANPAALNIYGYTSFEEAKKVPLLSTIAPSSFNTIVQRAKNWMEGKHNPPKVVYSIIRKDGEIRDVEGLTDTVRVHDAWYHLNSLIDITDNLRVEKEKIRLEEQVRHGQKMEAIGQLSGGIAHDFNNLLAAILVNSEALMANGKAVAETRELAGEIKIAAERAKDLIGKLISFSRKAPEQKAPVQIHDVLSEVVQILERTIDKRIRIKHNFEAHSNTVSGDYSQLVSAFLNLAINSRDAMPLGGELRIITRCIQVDDDYKLPLDLKPGSYIQVSVIDTGKGMDEDVQKHIFEPYFTTKPRSEGSGLGLASTYGCIKAHGGHVSFNSKAGEGTTFTVFLPLQNDDQSKLTSKEDLVSLPGGKEHILLVDDEELILRIASRLLNKLGYKVTVFIDPKEAITYFKDHHAVVDLVLLDIVMPNMRGKDVFNELVKHNPQVRVLLLSGFYDYQERDELIKLGILGIIDKPFTTKVLARLVREALDDRIQPSQ